MPALRRVFLTQPPEFFSRSPRGTSGETGRGEFSRTDLLSPALSSFEGGEGEDLLRPGRGCLKMRPPRILILPPYGSPECGAPVSDSAFPVQGRAIPPGRRPALRG